MRGFPFLNLLIALVLSGAVLWPLVWRSTQREAKAKALEPDAPVVKPEPGEPARVALRFVHAPSSVKLMADGRALHEWTAPAGELVLEESVTLPLAEERVELTVQITWPAGTPETVAELQVEPDGREKRRANVWSADGAADELIALTWKP
jgi:hypothetical protein